MVTQAASAVGVTAIPNPSGISGDPEAGWFLWQALSTRFVFKSGVGVDGNAGFHYIIDSRSMRKVGSDDDIVAIYDNETGVGASLQTNGRMLVQLH